ncbi:EGFR adapter protein-like [Musca vetustissima]|uniref:EGFR adapter protein-like n=1 Tax=Musca vetustissima TaxID=27455 RepID=UPI002AB63672|nr:EGFR adapter protein-like [Musca vetustissima]
MNNCRRLLDKPPLVKRLTMGMGLKRSTEDSRPLVHSTPPSLNSYSAQTFSDGYVNEAICDPDKFISTRFGDSCRQSLTDLKSSQCFAESNSEFGYQKSFLRKTCSANSSPKIISPSGTLRVEGLSPAEQKELKGAPWFQAGIPREISLEVLSKQPPGSFLVRQSNTKPGCFALSLRVPPPAPKVAHYLILKTANGYKIKGFTKEFSSLRALITHHSVMPELLPVPLNLPRPTTNMSHGSHARGDRGGFESGQFDTYGSLNDFRKMMDELNV